MGAIPLDKARSRFLGTELNGPKCHVHEYHTADKTKNRTELPIPWFRSLAGSRRRLTPAAFPAPHEVHVIPQPGNSKHPDKIFICPRRTDSMTTSLPPEMLSIKVHPNTYLKDHHRDA
ncbi:hypothetical protein C4D60_Mb08t20540 [Musa balbisiana]|uniref:Uncharacterized protein n=1 Tax=Musa balbisiana TaxID=52838 RepID=A0A4S8K574_MUSBA|nr:hypothetical protein C4D60_Mb08t20540 [Musa balbisiana]